MDNVRTWATQSQTTILLKPPIKATKLSSNLCDQLSIPTPTFALLILRYLMKIVESVKHIWIHRIYKRSHWRSLRWIQWTRWTNTHSAPYITHIASGSHTFRLSDSSGTSVYIYETLTCMNRTSMSVIITRCPVIFSKTWMYLYLQSTSKPVRRTLICIIQCGWTRPWKAQVNMTLTRCFCISPHQLICIDKYWPLTDHADFTKAHLKLMTS